MEPVESPFDVLLEGISKPGRYVGGEINAYRKDFASASVRFVLAFPDVYEVGLSHLGVRLLYHVLNRMDDVVADRVYAPWLDFEQRLRETGSTLRAVESQEPVKTFDFVGFSLQYELSYTNIFTILERSGVPLLSRERRRDHPWVIAGGPCAFNPEPLADVFDFIVLGEGETVLGEVIDAHREWRKGCGTRSQFLEEVRKIQGIYVPSLFRPHYRNDGRIRAIEPLFSDYTRVSKRVIADIDLEAPLPPKPLVPLMDIVHNRLNIEIARGCTRGCRFCQAGFIYRPVRERRPERILDYAETALRASGYEELSLLSLSSGDYSSLRVVLKALMDRFCDDHVAVALPSMRVGTLTGELMEQILKVRKTGFTLAPEAGSERLRRVINKGIRDRDLFEAVANAFEHGWRLLKLYFMIGLPTESDEDLEALEQLSLKVWEQAKPSRAAVNISVSTFVPKPLTPFQWTAQLAQEEIVARLERLKKSLRRPGLRVKWHDPGQSVMEAVLARGDRRLGPVIIDAWHRGARFDGWTEQFRPGLWAEAFARHDLDPSFYSRRQRERDEILPWDHLSAGVTKEFLWQEWQRGLAQAYTGDCRWERCTGCGVCDHKRIKPLVHCDPPQVPEGFRARPSRKDQREVSQIYRMRFSKRDAGRFMGQLELSRCFERAFRRAGLPAAYSRGYHPHIKLSFQGALPLGMESEVEEAYVTLTKAVDPHRFQPLLNEQLPAGIRILEMEEVSRRRPQPRDRVVSYRVSNLTPKVVKAIVQNYAACPDETVTKKTKRSTVEVRLQDLVAALRALGDTKLEIELFERENLCFRPRPVLERLSGCPAQSLAGCRIIKTAVTVVEGDEHVRRTNHQC